MDHPAFLPVLSLSDVEQASSLIQTAYTPGHASDQQRRLQQELFEIQKRPEAWGLVVPFLEHHDPNVQFFGAHTAQVKIARDWDTFPQDNAQDLRDLLLDITARSMAVGRNKVTLRKLFVAITSLALKLVPGRPSKWPDWILSSVTLLSARGASAEHILDFLAIVAEEVDTSDLLAPSKAQMQQALMDAIPMVIQAVTSSIMRPGVSENELHSAFKCLEVWIAFLPANDLTPLIPMLIEHLSSELAFIGASEVLQEILTRSSLSDGSGTKTITDPLLVYLSRDGSAIVEQTITTGLVDETSHSLCKLIVALGEHSTSYIAANISLPLIQTFLKIMLSYTALPGWYGLDEEESEMTLSFWYLLQEALWTVDFVTDRAHTGDDQWAIATALYGELVSTLKRKVTWPNRSVLSIWTKDQKDKFQVYRRDVGDTLINAYYILREDMLRVYVADLLQQLSVRNENDGWEDTEATLHCIVSVQEAVSILDNPHLSRLFGTDILSRLPSTGHDRVRRTALGLIGAYATWFTTNQDPSLLLGVLDYVVQALGEPTLCLQAANALRDLCDANRSALASHIAAFGELHASLPSIPDSEKTKVIQSIASVIQALPPEEEVQPVEAIVSPVVAKLAEALNSAAHLPDEARALAIQQLQTLNGCAKGLTRAADVLFSLDDSPSGQEDAEHMRRAREDPRMIKMRDSIFQAIHSIMGLWSHDATTGDALSELFKSMTALPSDMTLLTLPPGPLLELVCGAAQRHLNGVWLSLASMLIIQLDPPSLFSLKSVPSAESETVMLHALPILLQASLTALSQAGAMEANPDIVQAFFSCMDTVTQHFVGIFFRLHPGLSDALMQCAIRALSLQERYSLVSACSFIGAFINRSVPNEELAVLAKAFIQMHGRGIMRAILSGFAGIAPASTTQNLIELLSTMVSRCPAESKAWMPEILFSDDFVQSKATVAAKEKFVKAVLGSRSLKRTREAAQQFTLVAKGLEGSNFGYASVSM